MLWGGAGLSKGGDPWKGKVRDFPTWDPPEQHVQRGDPCGRERMDCEQTGWAEWMEKGMTPNNSLFSEHPMQS